MSDRTEKSGISHDTAARLIDVSPGELTVLVRDGYVHRNDKNSYSIPVLVKEYVEYLRAEAIRPEVHPKQTETAEHLDLSDRSIREWETKLGLKQSEYTLTEFRIAYIRHLREMAAGRAAAGDLDLATERARLAKEQADKISMQNAQTRKELAPAYLLEDILARTAARINGMLEAIPGAIKRRLPILTSAEIDMIKDEIAKARNMVASMRLEESLEEPVAEDQLNEELI